MSVDGLFSQVLPLVDTDLINVFRDDEASLTAFIRSLPAAAKIGFKWSVSVAALLVFSFLFGKRVRYQGVLSVATVALFVAPAHMLVGPIANALRLPLADSAITIILVSTVITGALIYACSYMVPDFEVDQFAVALVLAALMSIFGYALSIYTGDQRFSLSIVVLAPLLAPGVSTRSSRPSSAEP